MIIRDWIEIYPVDSVSNLLNNWALNKIVAGSDSTTFWLACAMAETKPLIKSVCKPALKFLF